LETLILKLADQLEFKNVLLIKVTINTNQISQKKFLK
jgi:hypothetical protein